MHTYQAELIRLRGLPLFPIRHTAEDGIARDHLRHAIESAGSPTDAAHVVDEILRTCPACPVPETIYELVVAMRSGAIKPTRIGCSVCSGMGWQVVPDRGVVRCACMPPLEPSDASVSQRRGA